MFFQNKKSGFTFIEVVIAISVFAIFSSAILTSVGTSFISSYLSNSQITNFFYVKNMFFNPENYQKISENPKQAVLKKIDNPEINLSYSLQENNNLSRRFNNCYIAKALGESSGLRDIEEEVLGIFFVDPQKDKETK